MSRGQDTVDRFNRDLERTIILGAYIGHWGMPETRVVATRGDNAIELYSFPPRADEGVHRFATVGISRCQTMRAERAGFELLLTVVAGLGGETTRTVADFVLDVAAYAIHEDVAFVPGFRIPASRLMPGAWAVRSVLVDEPLGEPESLEHLHVGAERVDLLWLIPIHEAESAFIANDGVDEFHRRMKHSKFSLVQPNRPTDAMSVTEE